MYCSGLKKIDVIVWFGDKEHLFVQLIKYDGVYGNTGPAKFKIILLSCCTARISYKASLTRFKALFTWWLGKVFKEQAHRNREGRGAVASQ